MALLDPKNVVAPLTNKVHLAFIFFGALLVIVLRYSVPPPNGLITTVNLDSAAPKITGKKKPPAARPANSRDAQRSPRTVEKREPEQEPAVDAADDIQDLTGVIGGAEPVLPGARRPKTDEPPAPPKSGLDDIERELGLR